MGNRLLLLYPVISRYRFRVLRTTREKPLCLLSPVATEDVYKRQVEGSDAVFFYNYGSIDTLQFVKVDAEIAADKYLGYKHLTDEECAARVYSFNYLHGLNMDTYLNVPEGKDSIVRVDEKGGKAWFQLEKVVKEDSYGRCV